MFRSFPIIYLLGHDAVFKISECVLVSSRRYYGWYLSKGTFFMMPLEYSMLLELELLSSSCETVKRLISAFPGAMFILLKLELLSSSRPLITALSKNGVPTAPHTHTTHRDHTQRCRMSLSHLPQ